MEPRKRAKKSQDPQPSKLVVISSEEQTKSSLTDEQFDTLTNDIDKVKQENQELKKIIVKQNDLIRKIQEEKKLEKESLPLHSVFPAQSILGFSSFFFFLFFLSFPSSFFFLNTNISCRFSSFILFPST